MDQYSVNDHSISATFDNDYSQPDHYQGNLFKQPVQVTEAYTAHHPIDGRTIYLEYQDPLKHVNRLQFQPCTIQMDTSHFVEPHDVKGYYRQDGTYVKGYYRDGDGNTDIDRDKEQGGGYTRSNPSF
ncbi:hypothetical protein MHZ95_17995 [Sporosarcina sp. ACRSM]|uniref:hypothetical protein n=1 Tax=Sporosarcina sp. ACRSM TaxID=2918216 RepID=UPI001EF6B28B|nr:hypothetical protein [Sporosarcina sp. ACRSM]MCG7337154.1 hypothetical protein [Sporosarcina sp. ACRSM]